MRKHGMISIGVNFEEEHDTRNKIGLQRIRKQITKMGWDVSCVDSYNLIAFNQNRTKSLQVIFDGGLAYDQEINKMDIAAKDLFELYRIGHKYVHTLLPKTKHKSDQVIFDFDTTKSGEKVRQFYEKNKDAFTSLAEKFLGENYSISKPTTFGQYYMSLKILSQKPILNK